MTVGPVLVPSNPLQALLAQARSQMRAKRVEQKKPPKFASAGEENEFNWVEVYQHSCYVYRLWTRTCAHCGASEYGLDGVYEERKHPRLPQTIQRRMAEVPDTVPEPVRLETHDEQVPVCIRCCGLTDEQIEEALNATTEEYAAEGEMAHSGAAGAGHPCSAIAA